MMMTLRMQILSSVLKRYTVTCLGRECSTDNNDYYYDVGLRYIGDRYSDESEIRIKTDIDCTLSILLSLLDKLSYIAIKELKDLSTIENIIESHFGKEALENFKNSSLPDKILVRQMREELSGG